MQPLRAFLMRHRAFAALLVAAALCMKLAVPAGYMVGTGSKVLSIEICADSRGQHLTQQIVIPQTGKSADKQAEHAKASASCPYSALSMASLGGADPLLLAAALAFILALGFAPVRAATPRRASNLRPPLRGPPALA